MRAPRFHHLVGTDLWARCDHEQTQLDAATATVRLATAGHLDGVRAAAHRPSPAAIDRFLARRGGVACVPCPPDRCETGVLVLSDPAAGLFALRDHRWSPLPSAPELGAERRFDPRRPFAEPASLARDPYHRFWLLERAAQRIRLLAEVDLAVQATVLPPPGAELIDLTTTRFGALAADRQGGLWVQPYGGEWRAVTFLLSGSPGAMPGYVPIAVAGHPSGRGAAILRPLENGRANRFQIAIIERDRAWVVPLDHLDAPLSALMLSDDQILIGEHDREAMDRGRVVFTRYRIGSFQLIREDSLAVRGFDGRAVFLDCFGRPAATTTEGVRHLFAPRAELVTTGRVETYALDSEIYGCVWHRAFVDVCLPPGTTVSLCAKTSDDPPPKVLRRAPRPPHGWLPAATPEPPDTRVEQAWDRLPLGSRTATDSEGWQPLGALDRRAALVDVPFPPHLRALPSEDRLTPRGHAPDPIPLETLEGLIKNAPGRYLWLRLHLRGTGRRTPALSAVRVTYPRPSMLDHLPAYWRAESHTATAMDHALALFEGHYTEIDQRIGAMRQMLDPRICPPEALPWLASLVALGFDTRIGEPVRRRLLSEITDLYRMRGTVPGLERLCAILAQCQVKVIEGFRVRRRTPAFLGAAPGLGGGSVAPSVLGPALQLGWHEGVLGDQAREESWETELLAAHSKLRDRRKREATPGEALCPADDPPPPLSDDPLISFYRHYAHRFSVLLFRPHDSEIESVIETAIEANKPAHTIHSLCWLDAGFRLGTNTYIGIGTRFAGIDRLRPAILGSSALGADRTLSFAPPGERDRIRVGSTRLGQSQHRGGGRSRHDDTALS